MSRGKELIKNTAIIAVGRISTQFISFFLLPLYTACLSTVEYGEVDLNNTIRSLLIPIVTLMLEQAVYVYMLEARGDKQQNKEILTTGFIMITVQCAIFCFLFLVLSPFVTIPYRWFLCINIVASTYSGFLLQSARGFRDITAYSLGSVITSIVTIILNIVCIVYLKMGPTGMLTATFIGNIVCVLYLYFKEKIYKYVRIEYFKLGKIKTFLQYSVPLIPNQLSIWMISASDRMIVSAILGNHYTGILAVVHKFPQVFSTIFNVFHISWTETVILHINDSDRSDFLSDMITKIVCFFASMAIGINCLLSLCFDFLVNASYFEAYYQIPINILAVLCNVVVGLLGAVYVAYKATNEVAKTTVVSGIINIITHFLLIKWIGLYAASISTLLGYGIMMIYRYIDVQKYIKLTIRFRDVLEIMVLYSLSCVFYYFGSFRVKAIACAALAIMLTYLNNDTIGLLVKILKRKK